MINHHKAVRRLPRGRGEEFEEVFSDREHRLLLGTELLEVCASALRQFKVRPKIFGNRRPRTGSFRALTARQILGDVDLLSDMLTTWQENADFLDKSAGPRVIPIRGSRPSFEALCVERNSRRRLPRLLSLALHFGMCKRIGGNRVMQLKNFVRLNESPTLLMAFAVLNVERFIATAIFNSMNTPEVGRVQRMAWSFLSEKDFSAFVAMARRSVASFADQQHRWLMAHGGDSKRRRGTRISGVSAFVFRD
jgi:hypothetical protein